MSTSKYLVCGSKPWHGKIFSEKVLQLPGDWTFCEDRESLLTLAHQNRYDHIFFLHWNWLVPSDLVRSRNCICFHMTDLPYGRGGSPLQNLLVRNHEETVVTMFEMTERFDAGPYFLKEKLKLDGSAYDIFIRATHLCWEMIKEFISTKPDPIEQCGEITTFTRRSPEMSEIPKNATCLQIYNHIRMLDAPTYPSAFLKLDCCRLTFTDAILENGKITARVTISSHID